MITKTDIDMIFSSPEQAIKAKRMAETVIFVYFQNKYTFLSFDRMEEQVRYQGRNRRGEDFTAYSMLWWEYRLTEQTLKKDGGLDRRGRLIQKRRLNQRGRQDQSNSLDKSSVLDAGHLREAEDMIGQIVRDGVRLSLHDCDPIQREDHSVGNQEDFFSMFCLMLAAAVPDIKFEGLCRSANPEH